MLTALLLAALSTARAAPPPIPFEDLLLLDVDRPRAHARAIADDSKPPGPMPGPPLPLSRPDPQTFFAFLGLCAPSAPCSARTGPAWMVHTALHTQRGSRQAQGLNLGNDVIIDLEAIAREPELDRFILIDPTH